jgi:2,3-bisphosphoglycerate-independent phosphoglycerate mutase
VGLPGGNQGSSEVGHLNMGAGRIVYQNLMRISRAIKENRLKDNAAVTACIKHVKTSTVPSISMAWSRIRASMPIRII